MNGFLVLSMAVATAIPASYPAEAAGSDPTTADCLAASEQSIILRNEHKLRDAREHLLVCATASCPADVRDECVRRVAEVNAAIPTIVFQTTDSVGNDLSAVLLEMDGKPLSSRVDGTAISIDPGSHAFTFNTAGQAPVSKTIVIRESEKGRRERIVFGTSTGHQEAQGGKSFAGEPSLQWRRNGMVAAAAVGLVGLGVGVGFGVVAWSRHGDAAAECPGACATAHGVQAWNDARSAGNVSTAGFVVGLLGGAGAGALWLTSPHTAGASETVQVGFGPGTMALKGTW